MHSSKGMVPVTGRALQALRVETAFNNYVGWERRIYFRTRGNPRNYSVQQHSECGRKSEGALFLLLGTLSPSHGCAHIVFQQRRMRKEPTQWKSARRRRDIDGNASCFPDALFTEKLPSIRIPFRGEKIQPQQTNGQCSPLNVRVRRMFSTGRKINLPQCSLCLRGKSP